MWHSIVQNFRSCYWSHSLWHISSFNHSNTYVNCCSFLEEKDKKSFNDITFRSFTNNDLNKFYDFHDIDDDNCKFNDVFLIIDLNNDDIDFNNDDIDIDIDNNDKFVLFDVSRILTRRVF